MKAKSIISLFIVFCLSLMVTTVVFAAAEITVPTEDLKTGDEFEMGIDPGEDLTDVEYKLDFDKTIFQFISCSTLNVDVTETSNGLTLIPKDSSELKRYIVKIKLKVITTEDRTANVILNCKGTKADGGLTNLTGMKGLNISKGTVPPVTAPTETPKNETPKPETPKTMPNTGSLDYLIPGIVVVVAGVAVVLYRKYNTMCK